ncbi:putative translocation protein Sec63 [Rosa chinensis]|uniref:Putative translocation protein Sec63 n=1 Tax=Rosa chinensis TaxID=74649 RepID=A0A2P6SNF6_ROSCH|nr:putative translocation protein Sec63 [Rosa chinensis]
MIFLASFGLCLPLVMAVVYLSTSSKHTVNYVMHQTLSSMKHCLAPSEVIAVFIKAAEYMKIPFAELLIQAQLTRASGSLSPSLQGDLRRVLEHAPRLLKELMKADFFISCLRLEASEAMTLVPRNAEGQGWLSAAIGVVELSQCIIQAVPLGKSKVTGGSREGSAPFLQLPHFSEVRMFQELEDRADLLSQTAGFSATQVQDVEMVLTRMPSISIEVKCETEGKEDIQESHIVIFQASVTCTKMR